MGGAQRLVAIDLDGEPGEASWQTLTQELGAPPPTLTSQSGREGGGRHLVYRLPPSADLASVRNRAGGWVTPAGARLPCLDVRAEGGQIVVAPSLHATGRRYAWDAQAPSEPAEFPDAWARWLTAVRPPMPRTTAPTPQDLRPPSGPSRHPATRAARYARAVLDAACAALLVAERGTRNDTAAREAFGVGGLLHVGAFSEAEAMEVLLDATRRGGWDASAEARTAETLRHQLAEGSRAPREIPESPAPVASAQPHPETPAHDLASELAPAATALDTPTPQSEPPSLALEDISATPTPSRSFERGDHVELAESILEYLGTSPLTFDAGEFWRYSPTRGVWELLEQHIIRHTVTMFAGSPVGPKQKPLRVSATDAKGAEAIARDKLLADANRVTFRSTPLGIAFSNGFVRVRDGAIELAEHAPANLARHGFTFDYEPWTAERTPKLNAFLAELFADCDPPERDARVALLQEFSGACLVGDAIRFQKCLLLHGEGGNGKSALLALLRAMFPRDALCSLPPQRWAERFSLEVLEGKRANFVSETPNGDILDGSAFKAVITGDYVTAERKLKPVFEFKPIAGHIFSTNWPLLTSDHSTGFWRRPIVLPCTRKFDGDAARVIDVEQPIIREELAGLVAFAIEGAARAQRQSAFTVPEQGKALAHQWRTDSDAVRSFLATRPDNDEVLSSTLFDAYKQWSKDTNHGTLSSTKFGLRVKATGLYTSVRLARGVVYTRIVPGSV